MVKKSLLARFFHRGGSATTSATTLADRSSGTRAASTTRARPEPPAPAARRPMPAAEEQVVEPSNGAGRNAGPSPSSEAKPASGASAPAAPAVSPPAAPAPARADAARAPSIPVTPTVVEAVDEVRTTIQQGLHGISSVLDGIDRKIDKQQKASEELIVSVRQLPDIIKDSPDSSKAGLELLARISTVLENQGKATSELLAKMENIPAAVDALKSGLSEQVGELARAHKNVDKTMHDTQRQLSTAFHEVRKSVDRASSDQDKKQAQMVQTLRAQQSLQDRRVEELLQRQSSATKLVVFLLVVSIVALLLVVRQIAG